MELYVRALNWSSSRTGAGSLPWAPLADERSPSPPSLTSAAALAAPRSKFLVDKKGNVIERYAPTTDPSAIRKDIEKLL